MRLFTLLSLFLLVCLGALPATAQLQDAFADGNFTQNPAWSGDVADFQINTGQQLQSNGPALTTTVRSLATPSRVSGAATWEFWANLRFATSSGNLADVFLTSDSLRLQGANHGYFVRLGGTPDEVSLFRKDGTGTPAVVIDGPDGLLASATNNLVRVRVTRDGTGRWTLDADPNGGTSYQPQGAARDTTYRTSSWFGVLVRYSATNNQKFFFDDFRLTDTTPPAIHSVAATSSTTLRLTFDEPLAGAQTPADYTVPGVGVATAAVLDAQDAAVVNLTFATPFSSGAHLLTVAFAEDLYGNSTPTALTAPFTYTAPAPPPALGDVRLNELYVDINPVVGLPAAPFVELLNVSSKTFSLAGWKLRDATTSPGTLGGGTLAPGQYAVLCRTTDTVAYRALLGPSVRLVGVTSLPTLNLTGDDVRLLSPTGTTIDLVHYADTWYNDPVKRLGGWSLEQINPARPCSDAANWTACTAPSGGTPGRPNSVLSTTPDATPPALVNATISSPTRLLVQFSEPVDTLSAGTGAFALTPALAVAGTHFRPDSLRFVTVILAAPLVAGTIYTLRISGVRDCTGNQPPQPLTTTLGLGSPPGLYEVEITEIFADESPVVSLPASEYLEIHNPTTRILDLGGVTLRKTGATSGAVFPSGSTLLPGQYAIVCGSTRGALFTGFGAPIFALSSFPSLNNAGDTIVMRRPGGPLLFSVAYADTWYRDATKAQGGWSLEMIDTATPCGGGTNWLASTHPRGGTPGAANSVAAPLPDTSPPTLEAAVLLTPTLVRLRFSEKLDSTVAASGSHYAFVGGTPTISSVLVRGPEFREVDLTLSAALPTGQVRTLTITGLTDCAGNLPPQPLTASLGLGSPPTLYEVEITEIFADESPVVGLPAAEYLEIHNPTTRILDLAGVALRKQGTSGSPAIFPSGSTLAPGQYAIVTSSTRGPLFTGFGAPVFALTNFPSLNNAGDTLVLRRPSGGLLFSVAYSDTWYQDAAKAQGGWSLELINTATPCGGGTNWIASTDPRGGTPGSANSVAATLPDNTPPALESAQLLTPTQIRLHFSEKLDSTTATALSHYAIVGGAPAVTATRVLGPEFREVLLTLSAALPTGQTRTLTITGLTDCAGNVAPQPLTTSLGLGISPNLYEVEITEIFADESPVMGLPAAEYLEIHNPTNRILDLGGVALRKQGASGSPAVFPVGSTLLPGQYAIVTSSTRGSLFANFGAPVFALTNFPSLNNAGDTLVLRRPAGGLLFSVAYSDTWYQDAAKAQGGWSLELIDTATPCGGSTNWLASTDPRGGTPGSANSVGATLPDVTAPTLESALALTPTLVRLRFSEKLDSTVAAAGSHYAFVGGAPGITAVVVPGPEFREVLLTLNAPLPVGQVRTLTITGLTDCTGNLPPQPLTAALGLGGAAGLYEVEITEIFADESPVVGLPASEYLEIHNPTTRVVALEGVTLRKQGSSGSPAVFPAGSTLAPGQYAIVCSSTRGPLFTGFGAPVFALTNFPSLNNTGDTLVLRRPGGALLFSVAYSGDWYRDASKAQGGWSLEMIDTAIPCGGAVNWTASADVRGGTPGAPNSAAAPLSDTAPPTIERVTVLAPTLVRVRFSEKLDSATAAGLPHYALGGGAPPITAVLVRSPEFREVDLTLSAALPVGQAFPLTVQGLSDCPGNVAPQPLTASVGLGATPNLYDVLITEILADESPVVGLPATEYLEIHNPTGRIVALGGLTLHKQGSSTSAAVFPAEATLAPGQYAIVTSSTRGPLFAGFGAPVFALTNFPALNSAGDTLVLRRADGQLLFSVAYTDDWYRSSAKAEGGWALEMIDRTRPCGSAENWIASNDPRGGSPGAPNASIASPLPDQTPPALEAVTALSPTSVLVRFTEKIDSVLAASLARYDLGSAGPAVAAVRVRGPEFREVVLTLGTALPVGQPRTLTVRGLTDCAGNIGSQPLSQELLVPETPVAGDVVINEVLFNPRTGGSDFVEVINRSTKNLDLRGWLLATLRADSLYQLKPVAPGSFRLRPGELAVFTVAPDSVARQYPASSDRGRMLAVAAMPSYSDDEGTVVVLAPDSTEIDRFAYSEKMHLGLLNDVEGVSLERVAAQGASTAGNFASASGTVGFATPGTRNSQSRPLVDVPGTGIELDKHVLLPQENDFVRIAYTMPGAGYVGNVTIFDAQGRLVKRLVRNQSLSQKGEFPSWDGSTDDNQKTSVGYYLIYAEVFDLSGAVKVYKQTVAVGVR